jgi:hypothetical protein
MTTPRARLAATLLCGVLFAACADEESCTLSGTLTYLGSGGFNLSGHTYELRLDSDTDAGNGSVRLFTDTWAGGSTEQYHVEVSAYDGQSFYLYAQLEEPSTYLIYGWYNTDPAQPFNPRDLVPVRCGVVYDFDIDAT